jgi:anti-sigma regulatory factor (Ser/Thr protein kinase)/Fe-S-cluster-containing hydrogenase component 2
MITMSCPIAGGDFDSAGAATRLLKDHLSRIGADARQLRRAMIAAYEAEMNVVIHARTGSMWARLDEGRLDLEVSDEGPGIPDIELAMQAGWSTAPEKARQMGFGAGLGLPNIRTNSDLFEIESRVGKGTRIRSTIYLRHDEERGAPPAEPCGLSIDRPRCRACLRCLFACPTGALRAHDDGPTLLESLCIGCTACIAECPDRVFAIHEEASVPPSLEGAVLVAPSGFFSGFPGSPGQSRVLAALGSLGVSEIRLTEEWEEPLRCEARGAAGTSARALPVIPPVCPAVVNLIEMQFPSLVPNLSPYLSPVEAAGGDFPLKAVVLVAACPSQYEAAVRTSHTGRFTVISPARLARELRPHLAAVKEPAGGLPVGLARGREIEGELRVSGIRHVQKILSDIETGALEGVRVLECFACAQGCVGSPLLGADPFVGALRRDASGSAAGRAGCADGTGGAAAAFAAPEAVRRQRPFAARRGARLDEDMAEAIRKLARIDELTKSLAGRDCGMCGAPSCAAHAEDVVLGRVREPACPYRRRTEDHA